jgi:hypothetical protein
MGSFENLIKAIESRKMHTHTHTHTHTEVAIQTVFLIDEFILHFYDLSRMPAFYWYFLARELRKSSKKKIHKNEIS